MFLLVSCRCFLTISLKFEISSAAEFMVIWLFFVWPQTCVKYCSQSEREAVFAELRPHLLTLACNTYAVHLLKKMIDTGMVMLLQLVYMFSYDVHPIVIMVSCYTWWCLQHLNHSWLGLSPLSEGMLLLFFGIWLDL